MIMLRIFPKLYLPILFCRVRRAHQSGNGAHGAPYLLFLYLTIFPALAIAAEKMAPPAFSWLSILNMLFGLIVVIALIYGLSWVLKKYGNLPGTNQVDMKVLGGISLGTRERAVLVQVEGKKILLGVAPGRVNVLHQFDSQSLDKSRAFEQVLAAATEQKS